MLRFGSLSRFFFIKCESRKVLRTNKIYHVLYSFSMQDACYKIIISYFVTTQVFFKNLAC